MIRRDNPVTPLFAVVAASATLPQLSSAEDRSLEQLADVVLELVNSIESEFECVIDVIDIDAISASMHTDAKYFATFAADGTGCKEASEELRQRGKAEGFVFFWNKYEHPVTPDKRPPILDLIHEIDPPAYR